MCTWQTKWSRDSLVSIVTRGGLEDPSSNLGWGKRYITFSAQRPHRLWGLPSPLFIEHRSKGAGERSLQHIPSAEFKNELNYTDTAL
jgi:hypothetical protein